MPISSQRNEFIKEMSRTSLSGRGAAETFIDFDPTGGMGEDDSDEEGDPFERMMRDR